MHKQETKLQIRQSSSYLKVADKPSDPYSSKESKVLQLSKSVYPHLLLTMLWSTSLYSECFKTVSFSS